MRRLSAEADQLEREFFAALSGAEQEQLQGLLLRLLPAVRARSD
jgi:hypothetical protein